MTAPPAARIATDAASLVEQARDGDLGAFESVYRMHAERVFAVCLRMARDRDEAEELSQDAWVRAWERLGSFRGDSSFGTWMHRLTVNVVLDRKRSDSRWRAKVAAIGDDPVMEGRSTTPMPGVRMDLERAVAGLPQGARTVFLLHEVEGFKHREIADRLGVAVGTVKAQLHRARRLLQEALDR